MITLTFCLGGEFNGVFADTKHPLDRSLLSVTGSQQLQPGGIGDLVGGPSGSLTSPNENSPVVFGVGRVTFTNGKDSEGSCTGGGVEDAERVSVV